MLWTVGLLTESVGLTLAARLPACGHAGPLALITEMGEASEWPEAVMVARAGVLSQPH